MDATLTTDRRPTTELIATALGAATSAFVVTAALAGHSFGAAELVLVGLVAAAILGLTVRQVPQRPLLRPLPARWDRELVVRAPQAADTQVARRQPHTGHAA